MENGDNWDASRRHQLICIAYSVSGEKFSGNLLYRHYEVRHPRDFAFANEILTTSASPHPIDDTLLPRSRLTSRVLLTINANSYIRIHEATSFKPPSQVSRFSFVTHFCFSLLSSSLFVCSITDIV